METKHIMATTTKKIKEKDSKEIKSVSNKKQGKSLKTTDTTNIPGAFHTHQIHSGLQKYFGFEQFKGRQQEAIDSLLNGRDTFVIMPTGGGKSLCYQLPAMILAGCAIIVSPLIALMKNQVDLVRGYSEKDHVAHFLNSSLNKGQHKRSER